MVLRNKYSHLIGSRRRGQFPSYSVHFSPEATYDSLQVGGSSRGQGSRSSDLESAKSSIIRHQEKAQSQFVSFNEIRQFLPVEIAETRSRKNKKARGWSFLACLFFGTEIKANLSELKEMKFQRRKIICFIRNRKAEYASRTKK